MELFGGGGMAVLIAAACIFIVRAIRKRLAFEARVNKIAGPPGWPLLGNLLELRKFDFDLIAIAQHFAIEHKHLFRFWSGPDAFVVMSNPEDVEIILASVDFIEKGKVYKALHPWLGHGLLTSTGSLWHSRRKLITPTFHFKLLDMFVDVFNKNSNILAEKLLRQKKQPIDVHHFVALCTLDVICGFKISVDPLITPRVTSTQVIGQRKTERSKSAEDKTSDRKDTDDMGIKQRPAFLDHLLDENDKAAIKLSDADIAEEVDTFMFEGHDTTSAAISFILYNIAAHPDVQKRIVDEMESIFGDSDRAATVQDLQNMSYVERVIKESLRLYPSVPFFNRKVPKDVPLPDGSVVPAGCYITISCIMIGRNPKHWPNPEKFDPDRFLPEMTTSRHPFAFVPFSAGPRNCIGQKFAMMELKSTVSKVVRRCKLSLPYDDYKPIVRGQLILKAPDGVLLKVEQR